MSSEKTLDSRYEELKAFWFGHTKRQFFEGKNQALLAYYPFVHKDVAQRLGTIVVVTGNSETAYKYREVVWDFYQNGYDVLVYEHCGQGASSPTLPPEKAQDIVHIERFEDYIADLAIFLKEVVPSVFPEASAKPLFLFAHSMGGTVVADYLLQGNPSGVAAAALFAPLFGLNTAPLPLCLAYGLFQVGCSLGKSQEASFLKTIQHVFKKPVDGFEGNTGTSSLNRYHFKQLVLDEKEAEGYAYVRKNTSSCQWFVESIKATDRILEQCWKLSVPTLIFQAQNDFFVKNKNQNIFCKSNSFSGIVLVPNSLHEIYLEQDSIRNPSMEAVLKFYSQFPLSTGF